MTRSNKRLISVYITSLMLGYFVVFGLSVFNILHYSHNGKVPTVTECLVWSQDREDPGCEEWDESKIKDIPIEDLIKSKARIDIFYGTLAGIVLGVVFLAYSENEEKS